MVIVGKMRAQEGFSLTELLVVIFIIGLIVGVGIILLFSGSAGTNRKAAAEILKEDLRRAYSLADGGARHGVGINMKRDRYIAVFHDATGNPANAFKIVRERYNGTSYVATDVIPSRKEENRVVSGTNWVVPSTNMDIGIVFPSPVTGEFSLVFESKGSVMTTDTRPTGAEKWVMIKTNSNKQTNTVNISDYGDITSI